MAVPATSFEAVVELANGRQPDILVIDAEGMDKPIIDNILAHGCRPAVIHFEIQCMDQAAFGDLVGRLSKDYSLFEFGNDITGYRNDIIMEYAKSVYIYNGLPTIFSTALRAVNGLAH